jgi:predicted RNA-binding protein (virulence factor B family)
VYVYANQADERIVASAKVDKFLDKTEPNYQVGEEVEIYIGGSTDLGFKAIINHQHWGVLFQNEVFQRLSFGQKINAFIKQVRPDGKIDLILQEGAQQSFDKHSETIINKLHRAGGFLPLTDKTDAEIIYEQLGMSKKAFKRAIGGLFKAGQLSIDNDGLRLSK